MKDEGRIGSAVFHPSASILQPSSFILPHPCRFCLFARHNLSPAMARPKIGFLPAFFTVLTIAFGIALWLRLRSYSTEPVAGWHSTTSSDTTMVIDSRSNATGSPAMAVSSDVVTTIAEGEARPSSSRKQARKQTPIIDLTRIPNPAAAPSLTTTAGKQRPGQRPGDKPSLATVYPRGAAPAAACQPWSSGSAPRPDWGSSSDR